MSAQNGTYDHASIAQAVAALLLGDPIFVHYRDEAERRRLGATFRRYATRLGLQAEIRTQEPFLIVRWNKVSAEQQN